MIANGAGGETRWSPFGCGGSPRGGASDVSRAPSVAVTATATGGAGVYASRCT